MWDEFVIIRARARDVVHERASTRANASERVGVGARREHRGQRDAARGMYADGVSE